MIESYWIYFFPPVLILVAVIYMLGDAYLGANWRAGNKKLKAIQEKHDSSTCEEDKRALQIIIDQAGRIQSKWILDFEDLDIFTSSLKSAKEIAGVYHPDSVNPEEEVRLEKLLNAMLFAKSQVKAWEQNKTVSKLLELRLRHVLFLSEAWEKKKDWDQSSSGRIFHQYKLGSALNWLYMLVRFMDLSFWIMKMFVHLLRDFALKQLLMRWTLLAGETCYQLYRETDKLASDSDEEKIWNDLDGISEPEIPDDFPADLQRIVDRSRNDLIFETSILSKERAMEIYRELIEDIAKWRHPESIEPLKEARLIDIASSAGRLLEKMETLRSQPLAGRLFQLRVSHILKAKDITDQWRESSVKEWADKYKLGQVSKISSVLFKAIRKQPGAIIQTAAFELLKEGGKRWFYIYIHGKLSEEAYRTYNT